MKSVEPTAWLVARLRHAYGLLKLAYFNLRQRDDNLVNVYRLARHNKPLPAELTVVSRVTGTRPRATLRYAKTDETSIDGTWKKTVRNPYEPEWEGEWVLDARDLDLGPHGEARLPDGRWLSFPYVNIHPPRGHTTEGVVEVINEPVWIIQNGSDAFGHWLLHVMPRIHRARQLDPTKRILTRHPGWNPAGLLSMVGLAVDDLKWFPDDSANGGYVHVTRGTFISHAAPRGNIEVHPLDTRRFDAMCDEFLAHASTRSPVGKRLYVSRSTRDVAQKRDGCINRAELEDYFAEKGFEVVFPERFSFPDQVAMFRDAEFIIGEGGSAPHLSLFSARDTKLVYVSARMLDTNNHWQRRIADLRQLNYRHIMPTNEYTQRKYTADMSIVRAAFESLRWPSENP